MNNKEEKEISIEFISVPNGQETDKDTESMYLNKMSKFFAEKSLNESTDDSYELHNEESGVIDEFIFSSPPENFDLELQALVKEYAKNLDNSTGKEEEPLSNIGIPVDKYYTDELHDEFCMMRNQADTNHSLVESPIPKEQLIKLKNEKKKERKKNKSSKKEASRKKNFKITNDKLAQLMIEENTLVNVNELIYYWSKQKNRYIHLSETKFDKFIRTKVPERYKSQINQQAVKEVLRWIKSDDSLNIKSLNSKAYRYIACKNGVYDVQEKELLPHSRKYFTVNIVNANFQRVTNLDGYGKYFEQFMDDLTNNDRYLYNRIQEVFGYIVSNIREVKYIPFLIGVKDTGKSVVLQLLEYLVGSEYCSNISLSQLSDHVYLNEIIGKKLNVCGELEESTLKRLDTIKKLSGGDMLATRALYGHPVKFKNTAAFLFAGNQYPTLDKLDGANAFSDRLVIIPFTNQIPREKQDVRLMEKLQTEVDYIFNWSIQGLNRWIKNNYEFTSSKAIDDLSKRYSESANSVESFIKAKLFYKSTERTYKKEIEDEYFEYCDEKALTPVTAKKLHEYLRSDMRVNLSRFRKNGENKHGYIGLGIKCDDSNISNNWF